MATTYQLSPSFRSQRVKRAQPMRRSSTTNSAAPIVAPTYHVQIRTRIAAVIAGAPIAGSSRCAHAASVTPIDPGTGATYDTIRPTEYAANESRGSADTPTPVVI